MNNTERTTAAPSSASPQIERTTSPQRRKIEHLFWVEALEFAQAHDLPLKALCGYWTQTNGREMDVVERVDIMPLPDPEDCRRCLRVLEARWRHQSEGRA